jgi:hypothetical protein
VVSICVVGHAKNWVVFVICEYFFDLMNKKLYWMNFFYFMTNFFVLMNKKKLLDELFLPHEQSFYTA